jgi:hypothetical protein
MKEEWTGGITMRKARHAALAGLVLALATAAAAPPGAGSTAARVVTYDDLGRLVRGYRGQVVVVDFWADY